MTDADEQSCPGLLQAVLIFIHFPRVGKCRRELVLSSLSYIPQSLIKYFSRLCIWDKRFSKFNALILSELLELAVHDHREWHTDLFGHLSNFIAHVFVYFETHYCFHNRSIYNGSILSSVSRPSVSPRTVSFSPRARSASSS